MVGNDVVDLSDRESAPESRHPRFDARVFTADEIRRVGDSPDAHQMRWIIWAAKESAYKLAKRIDPDVVFSHRAFETTINPAGGLVGLSRVRHEDRDFVVELRRIEDAVHAVCTATVEDRARVLSAVGRIRSGSSIPASSPVCTSHRRPQQTFGERSELVQLDGSPSEAVRELAVRTIGSHLGVSSRAFEIVSDVNRVPHLRAQVAGFSADLSLSHHGRYVAFACIANHDEPPGHFFARCTSWFARETDAVPSEPSNSCGRIRPCTH